VTSRRFSADTPVYCSNKTDLYDIAEILLKVTLSTIAITLIYVDNLILPYEQDPDNLLYIYIIRL
jgi:hypothetical protein